MKLFEKESRLRVVTFVKANKRAKAIVQDHRTIRGGLRYLDAHRDFFKEES